LTAHLNIEQRALARRLRAKNMSLRDIAKQIGCSSAGIDVMLRGQHREARPVEWVPRRGALSIAEREEILRGLSREDSLSVIARHLGRHASSVSREVKANGGRVDYRIWPAHQRAQRCAKRPKTSKLSYAPLAKRVTEDLEKLWSPEEHSALEVDMAMRNAIATVPRELVRSVTWDQGAEKARHV
jgi:IS30 family transposase